MLIATGGRIAAQVLPPCTLGSWEPAANHLLHSNNGPFGNCGSTSWPTQFNALHASLIPKGALRGWVIVWDHEHFEGDPMGPPAVPRTHRWALVDPSRPFSNETANPNPRNFCMQLPPGEGDLFCAGHAWTADGDLLVVGGSRCHTCLQGEHEGAKLAYLWIPPPVGSTSVQDGGTWQIVGSAQVPHLLNEKRWYPSVVALGPHPNPLINDDRMLVAGGDDYGNPQNSYQVWVPPQTAGFQLPGGTWEPDAAPSNQKTTYLGPQPPPANSGLDVYPRTHLVSAPSSNHTGRVALAGMGQHSDRVSHFANPGMWDMDSLNPHPWFQTSLKFYGSSVLLPILAGGAFKDHLLSVGGLAETTVLSVVERSDAAPSAPTWVQLPYDSLKHRRWCHNTVLLPDTRVLVVGGEKQWTQLFCSEVPALTPEVYDDAQPPGSRWRELLAGTIIRDYHSTALLLPSGKVWTSGGEWRHYDPVANCSSPVKNPHMQPADYQLYRPDYIACGGSRPVITGVRDFVTGQSVTEVLYGGDYWVDYTGLPPGVLVSRVTLLRPGSVTHHADPNQRCVEVDFRYHDWQANAVRITLPSKTSGILPRGYYMLFLVSSQTVVTQGVPSEAAWVKVR